MSGTQGRFPPAMPSMPPQGTPPHGSAVNAPANWPPAMPTGAQPGHLQAPNTPQFPPRFQPQPPAAPGSHGYAEPHLGGNTLPPQLAPQPSQQAAHHSAQLAAQQHAQLLAQQLAQQQAAAQQGWAPQPPQPFPPQPPLPVTRAPGPQPRQPDPAAYDLGNYGVPQTMPSARQQPTQPQWQADPLSAQPQSQQGHPPQFGQPQIAPQPGLQQHPALYGQQPQHAQTQNSPAPAEDYEYEDEPPRRKRRWLVAVALIGSIAAGGGMAFAYKQLFGPKPGDRNQVVRAQPGSVKSAPTDRGGKQMANVGSPTLNNRLPSDGSSSAAGGDATGMTNSSGVRIVTAVPVDSARSSGGSGVPGMQIVAAPGGFPSPGQINGGQPAIQPPPQRQAAVPVQQVTPTTPAPPRQQITRADPVEPAVAAPRRPPVVKEATATPAAPVASRPKPTGHVAVLGFRRTQLDAMKAMADVQQRYDVLRDKKLEIVQSDETARGLGVIYRIVVGPRAGIDQARELCNQLKQAGMAEKACYTMAQ